MSRPVYSYDDTETKQLESELIAGGKGRAAAKELISSAKYIRCTGTVRNEAVRLGDVQGMKYEFIGSNPQHHVVHYSLHVPGGYVRVVATSSAGTLDLPLVESVLSSITIEEGEDELPEKSSPALKVPRLSPEDLKRFAPMLDVLSKVSDLETLSDARYKKIEKMIKKALEDIPIEERQQRLLSWAMQLEEEARHHEAPEAGVFSYLHGMLIGFAWWGE